MKYAILLVAATLGSCLPQSSPGQKQLPFKLAPKGSGPICSLHDKGYSEDRCGTRRFCQAIRIFGSSSDKFKEKPQWDTAEACFEAHEQEPEQDLRPFHFGFDKSHCGKGILEERVCGTALYCQKIDELGSEAVVLYEDFRWNSTKECLDGHVAEPKGQLPWLEEDATIGCGYQEDYSEEICGTEKHCEQFNEPIKPTILTNSPYIWTEKECLAHHKKNPGALTFYDN